MPQFGDNETIPSTSDNKLTGSYPNVKTQPEINRELGSLLKEHQLGCWKEK